MALFTPQQVLKRRMVVYPVFAVAVIVALWIYWAIAPASAAGTGISDMPRGVRFLIAIAGTILVPIGLAAKLFKSWILISRGKVGEARFVQFGSATGKGTQALKFQYEVAGKPYTLMQSVTVSVAEQFQKNMKVAVIYDPVTPSRAQVFPGSSPQIDLSGPTVREAAAAAAGNTVFTIVVAVLLIAQWVVAIIALRLINDQFDVEVYGPASLAVVALTAFEIYLYDRWTNRVSTAYEARFRFAKRLILPLAIVSVIWTGWAMNSENQREAATQARERQSEADRAAAGKQQRDFAGAMQTVTGETARRSTLNATKP